MKKIATLALAATTLLLAGCDGGKKPTETLKLTGTVYTPNAETNTIEWNLGEKTVGLYAVDLTDAGETVHKLSSGKISAAGQLSLPLPQTIEDKYLRDSKEVLDCSAPIATPPVKLTFAVPAHNLDMNLDEADGILMGITSMSKDEVRKIFFKPDDVNNVETQAIYAMYADKASYIKGQCGGAPWDTQIKAGWNFVGAQTENGTLTIKTVQSTDTWVYIPQQ